MVPVIQRSNHILKRLQGAIIRMVFYIAITILYGLRELQTDSAEQFIRLIILEPVELTNRE